MNTSTQPGDVLFVSRKREIHLTDPIRVITARSCGEVQRCLAEIEAAVANGLHAAGFIAYEAARGFDAALKVHPPGEFPLLWFGIYKKEGAVSRTVRPDPHAFSVGAWTAEVNKEQYLRAIAEIRELIAAGDTYQVNYTFPMSAPFQGDSLSWFRSLYAAQPTDYAAYVDTGRFKLLSVSPELFFRLDGPRLETRPMKGTRPRGRWREEDRRLAAELASSEKERAENVMIVDLLRNDVGRVSEVGSVDVPRLFDIEPYETVWQMTSTITSLTTAPVSEILAGLFPSGSVTGAPKVRTMEIIAGLEPFPRGVYCGAIGWWEPGRRAEFNVAIRTVTLDAATGVARYHVGGGITSGSIAEAEYDECRVKAAVLLRPRPEFQLLESLLFESEYFLLDEHLARLTSSAQYFGFDIDVKEIRAALVRETALIGTGPAKVRLLAARDGSFRIEHGPAPAAAPVRLGFAKEPVDDRDVLFYHKTTHRDVYERARRSRPDCDDVLLWNEREEITESTTANVALCIDGKWLTPKVSAGLLPGTMRAHLIRCGKIEEAVLTKADVSRAESIALINSVRKWVDVRFVS